MWDVPIILALAGFAAAPVTAFAVLIWKIGRWQGRADESAKGLSKGIDRVSDRVDEIHESITEAHQRIDRHLEAHQ